MTVLDVPGACIYYEIHGSGPLLVLIPGASGLAEGFRAVTTHLAARYSVVLYGRRGFSRSRLDGAQDDSRRLRTDADDLRRLAENLGNPAIVFGAGSGRIVACEVLSRHPAVVDTLVPFEPPAVRYLPDGQAWVRFFTEVYDLYRHSVGLNPRWSSFGHAPSPR
jgi:pimeloyl-ACP methyl ester carboxylesterase